jgi:rhodanese-related sulfurtransferase
VREQLLAGREIALIDVREEDPFAQAHPLWAANLPLGRIELDAWTRIPRRDTAVVLYDDGEGLAEEAARRLIALGYSQVSLLEGGLGGWRAAGGELFRDVNVPSKSFGELVEAERHTPSLAAEEVQALLDAKADVVVLDARRFDEYQTMSIPGGTSVPGAELVLRAAALAPDPAPTSSSTARPHAQHHRHPVAGQRRPAQPRGRAAQRHHRLDAGRPDLDHGASRRFGEVTPEQRASRGPRPRRGRARRRAPRPPGAAAGLAGRAHAHLPLRRAHARGIRAGHLPGFRSAPGGQLVQETDHSAPVRGARIVLATTMACAPT